MPHPPLDSITIDNSVHVRSEKILDKLSDFKRLRGLFVEGKEDTGGSQEDVGETVTDLVVVVPELVHFLLHCLLLQQRQQLQLLHHLRGWEHRRTVEQHIRLYLDKSLAQSQTTHN